MLSTATSAPVARSRAFNALVNLSYCFIFFKIHLCIMVLRASIPQEFASSSYLYLARSPFHLL